MRLQWNKSNEVQLDLLDAEPGMTVRPPADGERGGQATPFASGNGPVAQEHGTVTRPSRHRATIDLRGTEERLQAFAAARHLTLAASVRRAVDAMLATDGELGEVAPVVADAAADGPLVKVTLRLPAVHVRLLALRARKADVSQGEYVAGLIEGTPLAPRLPDHSEVVAALIRSTSSLAALSVDLCSVARMLRAGLVSDAVQPLATIDQIGEAVRSHVKLASQLLADVDGTRRHPSLAWGQRSRPESPS